MRKNLSQLNLDQVTLRSIRRLVMGSIRGYELRERIDAARDWASDSKILKQMFLHQLTQSGKPQPTNQKRKSRR